jgi:hypothetical protein
MTQKQTITLAGISLMTFFEELGEWTYGKCQIVAKKYLFEQVQILLKQNAVFKYISNSETPEVVFRSSWKFHSDFVPMPGN